MTVADRYVWQAWSVVDRRPAVGSATTLRPLSDAAVHPESTKTASVLGQSFAKPFACASSRISSCRKSTLVNDALCPINLISKFTNTYPNPR